MRPIRAREVTKAGIRPLPILEMTAWPSAMRRKMERWKDPVIQVIGRPPPTRSKNFAKSETATTPPEIGKPGVALRIDEGRETKQLRRTNSGTSLTSSVARLGPNLNQHSTPVFPPHARSLHSPADCPARVGTAALACPTAKVYRAAVNVREHPANVLITHRPLQMTRDAT